MSGPIDQLVLDTSPVDTRPDGGGVAAVSGPAGTICPHCETPTGPSDTFCEQCGSLLDIARCPTCSRFLDRSGNCDSCGSGAQSSLHHSRVVLDTRAAGVCDRGAARRANQDAIALRDGDGVLVAAVADGVSSSPRSAVASASAAHALVTSFLEFVSTGNPPHRALRCALSAANVAAAEVKVPGEDAPATTIVAAALTENELDVIAVGDSRAYVVVDGQAHRVTVDDSWRELAMAAGRVTAEEADLDPRAHQITRWLGADTPNGTVERARLRRFPRPSHGWLLLCTDGLWNELSDDELAATLSSSGAATPEDAVVSLWHSALQAGGHDNISVIAIRFDDEAANPAQGAPTR